MTFKISFVIAFCAIAFSGFSQTDTGQLNNISLIKVNNEIYMLQSNGGNIGLSFGNDGVLMIDSQFAEGMEDLQKEIRRISKKPIRFLVNTHLHDDHTGGNSTLAKEGTIIFSQENVRTRLEEKIRTSSTKIETDILPIITFTEDITFHYNGEKIFVFHVHNAHTDGDAVIYFTDSNVIHTGDAFVNGLYPFIDSENGGSIKGYLAGLEKIFMVANEDTKIIPGHGKLATKINITETINMLTFLYKRISYFYGNQKTEEQVVAMKDLTAEYDAKGYGKGFITSEKIVRSIYKEVDKELGESKRKNEEARKKVEQMTKEYEEKNKQ